MPSKAGTKRRASSKSDGVFTAKAKQPKQDGQKAVVRKDLNIPLDEGFSGPANTVYVDDQGLIYDASLNQTNIGNNANKVELAHISSFTKTFALNSGRSSTACSSFTMVRRRPSTSRTLVGVVSASPAR